jgi:hypothetical protein
LAHWQARGWRFAVSADLSPALKQAVTALPETAWPAWTQEAAGTVREWAAVASVPSRAPEQRDLQPYRYVAIRVRKAQGELCADGNTSKHCAVVTNAWETDGPVLLAWQRGKAGTIAHVNRTLKDELGGGVYPRGKCGANAAWLRLQVLTLNLLAGLKAVGLDVQYRKARPKRLRFAIFTQFGRVVRHARQVWIRLGTAVLQGLVWPVRSRVARAGWGAP